MIPGYFCVTTKQIGIKKRGVAKFIEISNLYKFYFKISNCQSSYVSKCIKCRNSIYETKQYCVLNRDGN